MVTLEHTPAGINPQPETSGTSQEATGAILVVDDKEADRLSNRRPVKLSANPVIFVGLFVILTAVSLIINRGESQHGPFNWYVTIAWSLFATSAIPGVIGAWSLRRIRQSTFGGRVGESVICVIPTVGRHSTIPALYRVIESILEHGPRNWDNFRIDVCLDHGSEGLAAIKQRYGCVPHVRLIEIPESYTTPNGTRWKARANQFLVDLRQKEGENEPNTWIYHLDDDTAIGPDTVASIAELISNDAGKYHLAQGVLTFPLELTRSRFCQLADAVRPGDDMTRFGFFTHLLVLQPQ